MPLEHRFTWPLEWPPNYETTKRHLVSPFKVTQGTARDEMLAELKRLGARQVRISTNLPVSSKGTVLARSRAIGPPGVAVYFSRRGQEYVIACDRFDDAWANIRALGLSLEAIRKMERYGTQQLVEKAMSGFLALPPAPGPTWWQVLGLPSAGVDEEVIKAAYRTLAKRYHPDSGTEPDVDRFREVNQAYEEGMSLLSKTQ